MRPDRYTLLILTVMALLTISTPAVQLFDVPRNTLVSILFTAYMFVRLGGRLLPKLVMFAFCYLIAFLPSTIISFMHNEIKGSSFFQGILGLITLVVVGSYFYNWLVFNRIDKIKKEFLILVRIIFVITAVETIFYTQFFALRQIIYNTDGTVGATLSLYRELTLYGGRPMSFFSEPSHFARFIGLMMAAFIVATRNSPASLLSGGVFILITRSVSYFYAVPVAVLQVMYTLSASQARGRRVKGAAASRYLRVIVAGALAIAGIGYTQSGRIADALGNSPATASNVTGDGSLNERLIIPSGYLFNGEKSILVGLGPTPQDDMQDYTLSEMRSAYHWSSLSADYNSAISASILVVVGMGYVGITLFFLLAFVIMGRSGLYLVSAFMLSNTFSAGYNSTTSLVPSGLLLAILVFQQTHKTLPVASAPRR